ncbi:amidohydrolase family protein [Spiroplasma diminutum]|uniref:Dihydroorotase n=1 Tax=Spiroplasma diminutum CUAS-1 TaxID=1276221 RepID=S5LWS2_9MOLU|nr:amidohydrolase family protein [Spiroplasma diminutum]AGR42209.1 dihydroorotase [Spiroplasma diminutum CUAS-1]
MLKILNIKDINNIKKNIYIINGKILFNKPDQFLETDFEEIKFENDIFVSYGWMDSHVHCDETNKIYGSNPEDIGYKMGVTTIVDAGSVGIDGIEKMWEVKKNLKTDLRILLNISKKGIYKQSELSNLEDITFEIDKKYENFIIGFKARMSKSVTLNKGIKPLDIFLEERELKNIKKPLMVHIGNEPPKFSDISKRLRKGDIITHIYNYKNNSVFNFDYTLTNDLKTCINKGIIFDVGHGSESFNYKCVNGTYANGFKPDIISTDIYNKNIEDGTVKSLAVTMSKFRSIGFEWEEILKMVSYNPYKHFNLKKMGKIQEGYIANLTFFKIEKNKLLEFDSLNNSIEIEEEIKPYAVIVNGNFYEVPKYEK